MTAKVLQAADRGGWTLLATGRENAHVGVEPVVTQRHTMGDERLTAWLARCVREGYRYRQPGRR